jgi:hypothetical protein
LKPRFILAGGEANIATQQARFFPQIQQLGIGKTISDIQKNQAEAGKANAEAGAVPSTQALNEARTLNERFKEDQEAALLLTCRLGRPLTRGRWSRSALKKWLMP